MPTLTTLTSFLQYGNGAYPAASLIADAKGDLFGTTAAGGVHSNGGTVFEIVKTATGYASTPKTLVSFNGVDGAGPRGSLMMDAKGDLFGTTSGASGGHYGTVFELTKTATGYASTPKTLVAFNGLDGTGPYAGLIADAKGDLFGTTIRGGAGNVNGLGTVFEIVKTASGYASTPTTLVSFTNAKSGSEPMGSLVADAKGDLFGTTDEGGGGTVFEIAKTATGYASIATLVSFAPNNGGFSPKGSLILDAQGDLLGTTAEQGVYRGTVFEIKKTATGYASTATTLVNFNNTDGSFPYGSLIADAKGNLFGTTSAGGVNGKGTAFEIAKTANGWASAPTTLASFNGTNGSSPEGDLLADAKGDLFGTTYLGGANKDGTVFEITNGGFVASATATAANATPQFLGGSSGSTLSTEATADARPPVLPHDSGGLWQALTGAGRAIDFTGSASSALLLAEPRPADWQIGASPASGTLPPHNLAGIQTALTGTADSMNAHFS